MERTVDDASLLLRYRVCVADKESVLWYRFPIAYKDAVSYEVADGVVVSILSYAIRGGYHIHSEIPISEKLWFQLTSQIIPQLCATDSDNFPTEISAPLLATDYHPEQTATAMSCGVDSLTTFFQYTQNLRDSRWKLDLLTFFQNGAHHGGSIGHSEKEADLFQRQLEHVRKYCDTVHFPLLYVESNLDGFLSETFWDDSYNYTHTFRNAGFVLLLQKEIRDYYYAGVRDITKFDVSLWDDTELYDRWLLPHLSTDSTTFYSVSSTMDRIEKTQYLSSFPETYDHLLVCYHGGENCGRCTKCIRQLLLLDFMGVLDRYSKSFPVSTYRRERSWYILQMLVMRKKDFSLEEVYRYSLKTGARYSVRERLRAFIYRNVWKITDRKMLKREGIGTIPNQ